MPWKNIRVDLMRSGGAYVKLYNINTGDTRWTTYPPTIHVRGTCEGVPGEFNIEVGSFQTDNSVLTFVIANSDREYETYIPTIDGAWYCPLFAYIVMRCYANWVFVPASQGVPHFVVKNYTPGSTDGGGTPRP